MQIEKLESEVNQAEDALAQAWVELKTWMGENRLGVSALRSHLISDSLKDDRRLPSGHWTTWHMMSQEDGLNPEAQKLVAAIANTSLHLENSSRALHDANSFHVFTRSFESMLSGSNVIKRDNRTYNSLPEAIDSLRKRIELGSKKKSAVIGFVFNGLSEFGFNEDGELQGEPDATVVASNETIKKRYNQEGITITRLLTQPFIEV